jgi:hypothetical protein
VKREQEISRLEDHHHHHHQHDAWLQHGVAYTGFVNSRATFGGSSLLSLAAWSEAEPPQCDILMAMIAAPFSALTRLITVCRLLGHSQASFSKGA